jgi:hypothetical protein
MTILGIVAFLFKALIALIIFGIILAMIGGVFSVIGKFFEWIGDTFF